METRISGDSLPVVICKLNKGEQVITEKGGMSWMSNGFNMETSTNGGLLKGLGRALSGESIFMNTYTATEDGAEIAFASSFPGRILEFNLAQGQSIIAQKSAFLCSEKGVSLSMHFQKKFGAGMFGGEGFIMQKIDGPGKVFLEIDGDVVEKTLAPGEVLKVDNGYVAAMDATVQMNIETVKGMKNILLGGEGLFLTTLTGPGKVYLQTMPVSNLVGMVAARIPARG
ncbi:MAG: TIGR00266 family protein [Clostridia bacterium]|nr:TIGR00266 family protein [Clostridia bacterium]